jgi:hypothetical protein
VRLNNHEHTDIAEYIGTYVAAPGGGITFVEGALVAAVRLGHWIVLDELNLAPSDVLEALNRLLDDNRELFVPELQETVRLHAAVAALCAQRWTHSPAPGLRARRSSRTRTSCSSPPRTRPAHTADARHVRVRHSAAHPTGVGRTAADATLFLGNQRVSAREPLCV